MRHAPHYTEEHRRKRALKCQALAAHWAKSADFCTRMSHAVEGLPGGKVVALRRRIRAIEAQQQAAEWASCARAWLQIERA